MSESHSFSSLPEPLPAEGPPAASESPAAPAPPASRKGPWIPLVLVGGVAAIVGALVATAVTLAVTRTQPHEYVVSVFLQQDATDEQNAAVESALDALEPVERKFESREQAWENYRKLFKDRPDLLAAGTLEAMPESFRVTTKSRVFDCALLVDVRDLAVVDKIQVIQRPTKDEAGAEIACG
ncbi:cell division transport system permease protein [Micromonospora luteifusca]|uniref:Cell division transport system permease protein n=1 Tax=Micromonospora luteifusca TaxID=709860 RepID=A0ABS2LN24_9ACTN|nr:permease-like cell division protein FtsX [Micromonospora luteifusca]MBM7489309.1 cell division transport system permease protein [Micromonospora luteifusca]